MRNTRIILVGTIAFLFTLFYFIYMPNEQSETPVNTIGNDKWYMKNNYKRENATFVSLVRNSELYEMLKSIQSVQDRFNYKYQYDWVFLNNEEFSDEFKNRVESMVTGQVTFQLIPEQYWSYPDFIDQEKAKQSRQRLQDLNVMYASSESYRHMCRFESGFFYQMDVMRQYKYYWRVEPSTYLSCNIDYDVFKYMREHNHKYGWTLSITEYAETITTLWNTTLDFVSQHEEYLHPNRLQEFVTESNMKEYNLCHFWSNFEVGDMDFWRSKPYEEYFNFLDKAGGFFYERWGDAPVHSIAASLFMDRDDIHFFDDIAYYHIPFIHCPTNQAEKKLICACDPQKSFDFHRSSCLRVYLKAKGIPFTEL